MQQVMRALIDAGDIPPLPNTAPPPSVYLPPALPVVAASMAPLPWLPARLLWCLLSISTFAGSIVLLLRSSEWFSHGKWLLAAAVLFYSPTTSGLSTGNPSVLSCALVSMAVYLAVAKRPIASALALGIGHCIKPQISICVVALFIVWSCWKPLLLSLMVPVLSSALSVARAGSIAQYKLWLISLRLQVADAFSVGALNDPRPSNPFSHQMVDTNAVLAVFVPDLKIDSLIVGALAAAMMGLYLWLRRSLAGDRRWRDMAFFSALTLTIVYHRYYDAQLLLLAVPFVVRSLWAEDRQFGRRTASAVLIALLVFEFPLQALFAAWYSPSHVNQSAIGLLLFRHEPLVLVAMCLCLIPWLGNETRQAVPSEFPIPMGGKL